MCGLAGWLNWSGRPDATAVERMTTALAHRGPDAAGLHAKGPIALGHRRLSIIDVAVNNNQPLADQDEKLWIVFNGEIYNFRDIRRDLEGHGTRFRTQGDTEVIIEAYRRWGVDCLARFNGMFAFALWDEDRRELFVARDRAGEKPFFFSELTDGRRMAALSSRPSRKLCGGTP